MAPAAATRDADLRTRIAAARRRCRATDRCRTRKCVGADVAARRIGQRDRSRIHHHRADQDQARRRRPAARRLQARGARRLRTPLSRVRRARASARSCSHCARRGRAGCRWQASASSWLPRSARLLPHRLGKHLGAVHVVAEHVEARARRRQQHRVAALRLLERARCTACCSGRQRQLGTRPCRRARLRIVSAHRGRSAPRRAHARATARPAARSPAPCRRRRRSRPACALGAEAFERGDRGADVGALAVVDSNRRRRSCATNCTRCGSPRIRAARAASAPAAAPMRAPAQARPAHSPRCAAADRSASTGIRRCTWTSAGAVRGVRRPCDDVPADVASSAQASHVMPPS